MSATDRIHEQLKESAVVLYLNGTPVFPQCGFSDAVVKILDKLNIKFVGIDVSSDSELRNTLKAFSYAPSPPIPQLYIKGEFVGGCDFVREMYSSGELQQLFIDQGINPSN